MNKKNSWITIAIITGAVLVAALLLRSRGPIDVDSGQHLVMGTFARIVAVAADSKTARKAIEAGLEQISNIDELMSYHKEDSEIN